MDFAFHPEEVGEKPLDGLEQRSDMTLLKTLKDHSGSDLGTRLEGTVYSKFRSRETSYEETPGENDGGVDQCDNGGNKKLSDSGYILKTEPTGSADGLDVTNGRPREVKRTLSCLA